MINTDIAINILQDLVLSSVNLTDHQKAQIKEAIKFLGGDKP